MYEAELRSVEIARKAFKQGFRIIAQKINKVAPPNLHIKTRQPDQDMNLSIAKKRWFNGISVLRSLYPDLPADINEASPWSVVKTKHCRREGDCWVDYEIPWPLGFDGNEQYHLESWLKTCQRENFSPEIFNRNFILGIAKDELRKLLHLRKELNAKRKEAPLAVGLTDEDCAMLVALADNHPRLLTQAEIEGAIPKRRVALRTIQKRLPRLCKQGYVDYPQGKRSGCGITAAGLIVIGRKI